MFENILTCSLGDNLKNPKISKLTGHGKVQRKPVADDGKSLRSRKSSDDPFADELNSSGFIRTPTKFDARLRSSSTPTVPPLPTRTLSIISEAARVSRFTEGLSTIDASFDALLSSSPLGQSTPRIRIKPSMEESDIAKFRNEPSHSRTSNDQDLAKDEVNSDMELDSPPLHVRSSRTKRKNSRVRGGALGLTVQSSKRMKKHPSPSKAELEVLEQSFAAMQDSNPDVLMQDELAGSFCERTANILGPKDANTKVRSARKNTNNARGKDVSMSATHKIALPEKAIVEMTRRRAQQSRPTSKMASKIPKPVPDNDSSYHNLRKESQELVTHTRGGIMEMDELSWDKTAYNVGRRRVR